MNPQIKINFETKSPINKEKLSKQARQLCEYILNGNKLSCYSSPIGFYNSKRIHEIKVYLLSKGIELKSKMITVNRNGELVSIKEHWV